MNVIGHIDLFQYFFVWSWRNTSQTFGNNSSQ